MFLNGIYSSLSNHTEHTPTILLTTEFARERNTLEVTLGLWDTTSTLETLLHKINMIESEENWNMVDGIFRKILETKAEKL